MVNKELVRTYTFQMNSIEMAAFEKAYEDSGFRSKSEFIRFILFQGVKDFYGRDAGERI